MEILNAYPQNWRVSHKNAVIGFYYPNGTFEETESQSGISFALDHLLYLALFQEITDSGNGRVRCFTDHSYSAFLIQCNSENAQKIFTSMDKILFKAEFNAGVHLDELTQWMEHQRKYARTQRKSLDSLYYAKRLPGTPLAQTQSERLNRFFSRDELIEWYQRFVQSSRTAIITSGVLGEVNTLQPKASIEAHNPPGCTAEKVSLPRCIPWKRSELVISIPYEITTNNILATEAACGRLDSIIARTANRLGCKSYPVQYCPDFYSELKIRIQCSRGKEQKIVEEIFCALKDTPKEIGDKEINKLRKQVYGHYLLKASDPFEWNRFAGYNAMSGNRYPLKSLLESTVYKQAISAETVLGVLTNVRHEELSFFATAAR